MTVPPLPHRPTQFSVDVDAASGLVRVAGVLDDHTSGTIRECLGFVTSRSEHAVTLDLSGVHRMSQRGALALERAVDDVRAGGARVEVTAQAGSLVERLLDLAPTDRPTRASSTRRRHLRIVPPLAAS